VVCMLYFTFEYEFDVPVEGGGEGEERRGLGGQRDRDMKFRDIPGGGFEKWPCHA